MNAGPESSDRRNLAEAESHKRSSFVASLSHELHKQLSVILGMSRLLLDAALDEGQAEVAGAIVARCERLLGGLGDLVSLSRIEAGQVDVKQELFRVHGAIKGAVANLVFKAHEKNLQLRCDIDAGVPAVAIGDASKLRQVVTNLVDNAVKYTSSGQVRVQVTLEDDDDEVSVVRMSIHDTGPGIRRAEREVLLRFLGSADPQLAGTPVWAGMGLAICRDLAKIVGGEIGFDSEEGAGSTFWFRLRLRKAGLRVGAQELAAPPRILLVCGHPDRACRTLVSLHRHAFRVDLETDRSRLRQASRSGTHDLILLDDEQAGHYATFATWGASDALTLVPVLGVPRCPNQPDDVDESRLLDLVGKWTGRLVAP